MRTVKTLKYLLLVVIFTSLLGCNEWLNLKPESEIILDEYWQNESDVDFVLSACYRGLTEESVIYRMIVWGELRSDNMTTGSSFSNDRYDMQRILDGDITATNKYCDWSSFYSIINYCNTLLYYAPFVVDRDENFTENDLHRAEAEAYAIRSLCYFYLVRAFKEVPWITDPSIDDTQDYNYPKESEDVILNHLIEDLTNARQYASTDFGKQSYNKGRFTRNGIDALLADIYLWKKDYSKCVESCNNIIADKNLKLVEADLMYSQVFYLGNSTESIFELQFNEDVQKNYPVFELYGVNGNTQGEIAFPATVAYDTEEEIAGKYSPFKYVVNNNLIESADDIRAKDFFRLYGGKFYIFKYAGLKRTESLTGISTYTYRNKTSNWIVYRLSDVLLMKAEALVQTGGEDNLNEALTIVNKTYLRSNEMQDSLNISNYTTSTEMGNLVLRERQRELLFEGKRWFDLVRVARRENSTMVLNDYMDHKSSGESASLGIAGLDGMYMPISKYELEANPKLVQNPYYKQQGNTTKK